MAGTYLSPTCLLMESDAPLFFGSHEWEQSQAETWSTERKHKRSNAKGHGRAVAPELFCGMNILTLLIEKQSQEIASVC